MESGRRCDKEKFMGIATKSIQDALGAVIDVCRLSAAALESAAGAIDNDSIRKELRHYCRERVEFSEILAAAMEEMGYGRSTQQNAHMGNQLDHSEDDCAILDACSRQEEAAMNVYADAIDAPMPREIAELISAQYQIVMATQDRIRDLRDAAESSATVSTEAVSIAALSDVFESQHSPTELSAKR
jgi:uncharacterized protein (TIGR02284 family)